MCGGSAAGQLIPFPQETGPTLSQSGKIRLLTSGQAADPFPEILVQPVHRLRRECVGVKLFALVQAFRIGKHLVDILPRDPHSQLDLSEVLLEIHPGDPGPLRPQSCASLRDVTHGDDMRRIRMPQQAYPSGLGRIRLVGVPQFQAVGHVFLQVGDPGMPRHLGIHPLHAPGEVADPLLPFSRGFGPSTIDDQPPELVLHVRHLGFRERPAAVDLVDRLVDEINFFLRVRTQLVHVVVVSEPVDEAALGIPLDVGPDSCQHRNLACADAPRLALQAGQQAGRAHLLREEGGLRPKAGQNHCQRRLVLRQPEIRERA